MGLKRRTYGPAIPPEGAAQKRSRLIAGDMEKDQILRWPVPVASGRNTYEYAIVRETSKDRIAVAPVVPTSYDTKCYNEGGSTKDDKDNVLLRYSTELFEHAHRQSVRGCYAIADNENPIWISQDFLDRNHVDDMDGIVIDERDSRELDDHPWRDELQRQKRPSLLNSVSTDAEPVLEPEPTRTRGRDISQRPLPTMPSEQADGPDDGLEY